MKSLKILVKRILLFLIKSTLVAIPAVVASYYSYQLGVRQQNARFVVYKTTIEQMTDILDRQAHIVEHMRGEMDLLKLLVNARSVGGFAPLPMQEGEPMGSPQLSLKGRLAKGNSRATP